MPDDAIRAPRSQGAVRGGLLLMAAKAVGVASGSLLYVLLLPLLHDDLGAGGTVAFGVFGATLSVLNPLNMMFAQGALASASRLVASRDEDPRALLRRCASVQLPWMLAVLGLYVTAAPLLARHLLRDPSYTPLLRWGAAVPAFYAVRGLVQGYCNGTRRYSVQAWLDAGGSSTRVLGVLAGAALGFGVVGALAGFIAASGLMAAVAVWVIASRAWPPAAAVPARTILGFGGKTMLLTGATYALMSIDVVAVKALAHADPVVTDRLAGYLTASQKVAQIPWGILTALTWALFPLFAQQRDRDEQALIVRQGVRALLLLVVPVATVLAATARPTYALLFPGNLRAMVDAGDVLRSVSDPLVVHALGYGVLALLVVCTSLLTAGGRPGTALGVVLVTGAASTLGARGLTPLHGTFGAALGTSLGWCVGLLVAAVVLGRLYGAIASPGTVLRVLASGALVFAAGWALAPSGAWVLAVDVLLLLLFGVLLVVTRETSWDEIRRVTRAAARRRGT